MEPNTYLGREVVIITPLGLQEVYIVTDVEQAYPGMLNVYYLLNGIWRQGPQFELMYHSVATPGAPTLTERFTPMMYRLVPKFRSSQDRPYQDVLYVDVAVELGFPSKLRTWKDEVLHTLRTRKALALHQKMTEISFESAQRRAHYRRTLFVRNTAHLGTPRGHGGDLLFDVPEPTRYKDLASTSPVHTATFYGGAPAQHAAYKGVAFKVAYDPWFQLVPRKYAHRLLATEQMDTAVKANLIKFYKPSLRQALWSYFPD